MGDPKFPRRRYDTPSHPWEGERIAAEKALVRKYGLKNKREVWKAQSRLRTFRGTARGLLSKLHTPTGQVKKESSDLLRRMNRLGFLGQNGTLDDILGLDIETVLGRRLQTVVYLKGLSSTPKQARQFIIHGHVTIGGQKVTVPSYLVTREEEDKILLNPHSPVADESHPVRSRPEAVVETPKPERKAPEAAPKAAEKAEEAAPAEGDESTTAEGEETTKEGGEAA
ncbi:MAG: 30S ribosomal protein S4 [Euryarchaeota archaeon]|nr:30S ribosomal protein S4 [Euryarchaeota archaeon]